MIFFQMLNAWDRLLGAVGIIAIVVIAFRLMLRNMTPGDAVRSCLFLCFVLVLLSILPAMLVDTWLRMSLWQHLGIFTLITMVVILISIRHRKGAKGRRAKIER